MVSDERDIYPTSTGVAMFKLLPEDQAKEDERWKKARAAYNDPDFKYNAETGSYHRIHADVSSSPYPACAKCGCDTQGEEAMVGKEIWCHPCADEEEINDQPSNDGAA